MAKGNPNPIGRRASTIRPGLTCKAVLMGELPLPDGKVVNEASINDLHAAYMDLIEKENMLRPPEKRLRGMASHSWYVMFKFAQMLGLVKLVREEKTQNVHNPRGTLYSLRKRLQANRSRIVSVVSKRRIFTLTEAGRADEVAWGNLTLAGKNIATWTGPKTFVEIGRPEISSKVIIPVAPPPEEEAPEEVEERVAEVVVQREAVLEKQKDALIEELDTMLDDENKAASIAKVVERLVSVDVDTFTGIEEIEDAIQTYKDVERAGKTREEYADEKQDTFEEIRNAIQEIEVSDEALAAEEEALTQPPTPTPGPPVRRGRGRPRKTPAPVTEEGGEPAGAFAGIPKEEERAVTPPPKATFKPFVWREKFTPQRAGELAEHVKILKSIGLKYDNRGRVNISDPVYIELDRLESSLGDWMMFIDDQLEEAKSIGNARGRIYYQRMNTLIISVNEGFKDFDFDKVITGLEALSKM